MNGVRIIRQALSVPAVIGAAAAILLISQTANAFDRPRAAAIDNPESTRQATDQASTAALVSDHLFRSLLIYNAQATRDLFPALGATASSHPRAPGADSALPPADQAGLSGRGSLSTAGAFSAIEQPTALVTGDTAEPDPGSPGQRSRKSTLAPGTSPMTTSDKFNYFLRKSFVPPWPYAMSILGGVVSQALDTKDKKHRENAGEFMVGSMEH